GPEAYRRQAHQPFAYTTLFRSTRIALREAGITITGVYGTDPGALERMLRGARLTGERPGASRTPGTSPPEPGSPVPSPFPPSPSPPSPSMASTPGPTPSVSSTPREGASQEGAADAEKRWVKGMGFDTCTAPAL